MSGNQINVLPTDPYGEMSFNYAGLASANFTLFNGNGTAVGRFNGSTGAYSTLSDRRLKENIATSTLGLDTLMQLVPRQFDYTGDPTHRTTAGFVAQEVEGVFPFAVTTNGDNGTTTLAASSTPWAIDYATFTPLIVAAVQDLNRKVDAFASSGTTTAALLLATSTPGVPWLGAFANASQTLKDAISGFGDLFVQTFKGGIYATAGFFDNIFAQTITATVVNADTITAKKLCLDDVCVTKTQLQQMLSNGSSAPQAQIIPPPPAPGGGDAGDESTSTPNVDAGDTATTTPPSDDTSTTTPATDGSDTGTTTPQTS